VTGQILITGSDGYLGRRVAARLLADGDQQLVLAVRAADGAELAAKQVLLRRELGQDAARAGNRIKVVAADLRSREPFAAIDPARVTCLVHAAARTAFNLDRRLAREVNVSGTQRVAMFARRSPRLERLLLLSTLFSSGRATGAVPEVGHDDRPGFANHYEWSKHEAERHLLTECADLPVSIARLTTVVADDDTGVVTQHNVFHNTLKLFFYGLLSLVPGDPRTRQYYATADFTSRGVAYLARSEVPPGIYHLAPGADQAITLSEVLDTVFGVFETDPGYRRRRLLRPSFCDLESFRYLAEAASSMTASPTGQALGSVAPFAEQMFLDKDFDNTRLRSVWPGYQPADLRQLVAATCGWLVRTRWGRRCEPAAPAENASRSSDEP
jgi:nucleoside-diphosphate-sugar epimerase